MNIDKVYINPIIIRSEYMFYISGIKILCTKIRGSETKRNIVIK